VAVRGYSPHPSNGGVPCISWNTDGLKREERATGLPAMTFPRLPGNGGNVHAGKELLPGFHILFLRRRNRVNRLKKKPPVSRALRITGFMSPMAYPST
jgi:hypothetical protein